MYFSEEDPEYPAEELNVHSPHTRGWQSGRFCEYPQELGLQISGGIHKLSQVQILSHQSKIASKIEIYVGNGGDYHSARYNRLGYLSLDNNERSSYQARELKTVYLDHVGNFVKLVIHQCHANKYNLYNQVGIVAVNLIGSGDASMGDGSAPNVGLGAGAPLPPRDGYNPPQGGPTNNAFNDLSIDLNLDSHTAGKLRLLSEAKAKAVEQEDYSTAKQIKTVEQELRTLGSRLAQLDVAKRQAVGMEDYDRAKTMKEEMDELRVEIEQMVRDISIPGIVDNRYKGHGFTPRRDDPTPVGPSPAQQHVPIRRAPSSAPPVNVDEIPVGGGPGVYDESKYEDESEAMGERSIKSKGVYPDVADNEDAFAGASAAGGNSDLDQAEKEAFPPGQHPLEGINNFNDLPSPESITSKSDDYAKQLGIVGLLGEYRARCLFSRTWALREAAVSKTKMMLTNEFEEEPGLNDSVKGVAGVIRVGMEDKFQQVFYATLSLLDEFLIVLRTIKVSRASFLPLADPMIVALIEKLSDGGERIRKGARRGLEALASSPSVGPAAIASHALKSLNSKQKQAWRPILGRLQTITDLINQYSLGQQSGLSVDAIMNCARNMGALTHSNGEVRDAAKEMTVALQKQVGTDVLEGILKAELRPKQLEEYYIAFGESPNRDNEVSTRNEPESAPRRNNRQNNSNNEQVSKNNASNNVPNSARDSNYDKSDTAASGAKQHPNQNVSMDGSVEDFTVCSFCGAENKKWNEDALDLHYWKECPLLCPCPACAQVVEIAGLPDHLLTECEQKSNFVTCEVTGLAIRIHEFDSWSKSPTCRPPPANCMYCPLCLATVEDSDEAWRLHLSNACPQNPRCIIVPAGK